MKREQIINQFVTDHEYKSICRSIAGSFADDLYQELVLIILEIPEGKLSQLNETCLKCFFYRIAKKQFCSTTSPFYKKYFKADRVAARHAEDIRQAWSDDSFNLELMEKVVQIMEEIYWYDEGILSLYAEKGTYREVSVATSIPIKSIHNTVTNTKKIIRKKLKRYD